MKKLFLLGNLLLLIVIILTGCGYVSKSTGSMPTPPTSNPVINYAWQAVPTPNFTTNANDLHVDNGIPYILRSSIGVYKFTGAEWERFPGNPKALVPFPDNGSLYVYQGTPYIAVEDYLDGITVLKNNGTDWEYVGERYLSRNGLVLFPDIEVYEGTPYVAYRNLVGPTGVSVKKFNGTNWVSVGNEKLATCDASFIDLTIYEGTPYIAYEDYANFKVTIQYFDGTIWHDISNHSFKGSETKIAVHNCIPYVAFEDAVDDNKLTVIKYENGTWSTVGEQGFTSALINEVNLQFMGDVPYVAYEDTAYNRRGSVRKFNGSNWEYVGEPGFTIGRGYTLKFFIGDDNIPYVFYTDIVSSNKCTVMKYDVVE